VICGIPLCFPNCIKRNFLFHQHNCLSKQSLFTLNLAPCFGFVVKPSSWPVVKIQKCPLNICYVHYLAWDSAVFIKYRENYAKFDILKLFYKLTKFVDCDLSMLCNYVCDYLFPVLMHLVFIVMLHVMKHYIYLGSWFCNTGIPYSEENIYQILILYGLCWCHIWLMSLLFMMSNLICSYNSFLCTHLSFGKIHWFNLSGLYFEVSFLWQKLKNFHYHCTFRFCFSCGNSYETEAFMVFYQGYVLVFNFSCKMKIKGKVVSVHAMQTYRETKWYSSTLS